MEPVIQEQHFDDADSFWGYLSAPRVLSDSDDEMIYRGHANADWELLPTILRPESAKLLQELFGRQMKCEDQAWAEFLMLRSFIFNCDEAGVAVPNDSVRFRKENLTYLNFRGYYKDPSTWPNDDLIEAMAMARLHGLPTRLLDWTINPYVAVYFAVGEALRTQGRWRTGQRLAVFELNKGPHSNTHCGQVKLLRVRGSISKNIVAQQGLFTVHPMREKKGEFAITKSLEQHLSLPPDSPIRKLTVPIKECVKLYKLCDQFSYNAARLYPGADGASRSVTETQLHILAHAAATDRS